MKSPNLLLSFEDGSFLVTITNTGSEDVRLWGKNFLYGYYAFSLLIRKPNEINPSLKIGRKSIGWTVNVPDYFELNPGQSLQLELDIKDGNWDLSGLTGYLNDAEAFVSVELFIEENELTREYNITTGRFVSNEVRLQSIADLVKTDI